MTTTTEARDLASRWRDDGCLLLPRLFDPERVARLRALLEDIRDRWLARDPLTGLPGGKAEDAVCMRHVNHPVWFTDRRHRLPEILDACAEERMLAVLRERWGEEPMLRSTSLFFNPKALTVEGHWHRDTQFTNPDVERERAVIESSIASGGGGAQIQISLVASEDLEYVLGSHRRWDTDEELRVRKGDEQGRGVPLPGARRIRQEPGDAAYFTPFGLHRGRYHADKPRCSLMLTYGRSSWKPGTDRFSYQPWCLEPGYLDGVVPTTRAVFERFIAHYRELWLLPRADLEHSGL